MLIKWNGHASFTLRLENGTTVVTDPFDPSVGYECPTDRADIVTVSHSHSDHSYTDSLTGPKHVINKAGEYAFDGVTVSAIESYHDDAQGKKRGSNLLVKIQAEGKTVVHLGDLGHFPNDAQLAFIKNADVLMIPVGGYFTIDSETALSVVKAALPKKVIPMHFKTPAIDFPISDEKAFAAALNAVYCGKREMNIGDLSYATVFDYK